MRSAASRIRCTLITELFLFSLIALAHPADAQQTGTFSARIVLVGADLSLKPVPKKAFSIRNASTQTEVQLVTSFTGEIQQQLEPGAYVITNGSPVELEGRRYSWNVSFVVTAGETTSLDLSNDNAVVEAGAPVAGVFSETDLYNRFSGSVFKVIAEGAHGSGFLIDERGLVLTNHHVIAQSQYLALNLDPHTKYPATLVAQDEVNDIAVLRINPLAVKGRTPLGIVNAQGHGPIVTGEKVLAIGSPLATETIVTSGIVSKVERGAIYSDVNINPGNSGGPLLNANGEVIGIATFGLPTNSGPGVSGIVRIELAAAVLATARATLDSPPPPYEKLPVPSDFTFPAAALRQQALSTAINPRHYHLEMGSIDVTFVDPVVIASLEVESEKTAAETRGRRTRGKAEATGEQVGSEFYEWRRYTGDYRPVVTVQATPELGMPPGSWLAAGFGATTGLRYWFKSDFGRMELLRDGIVVLPLHPGRVRQVVDANLAGNRLADIAYYGAYEYAPEAFKPDAEIVLRVWEQGKKNATERTVSKEIAARIWGHFSSYYEAIAAHAQ